MRKIISVFSLALLLIITACGSNVTTDDLYGVETSDSDTIDEQSASVTTTTQEEEAPEREKIMAPDFTLLNSKGEKVSLSDYQGKIVFLNFFTTWCTYCEIEMPDFQEASIKYADDVEFLIVDVFPSENISQESVIEWYESRGFTMPMVIDVEGELSDIYPVNGFPTTYFIDRDGSVIAYYPGAMTPEIIDQVVEEFR